MQQPWTHALRLSRIDLELAPTEPVRLLADPDRLLRGLLGRAVFDLACAREHRDCGGCDLRDGCEIPGWYDPGRPHAHAPRPVLPCSESAAGELLSEARPWRASLTVLGPVPRPSLLVEALERLGRNGLGEARVPLRLARMQVHGEGAPVVVIRADRRVGSWPEPGSLACFLDLPDQPAGVDIWVQTPLRLSGGGSRRWPELGELLWAALGRVRQVLRAQGIRQPPAWPDPRRLRAPWAEAVWHDGERRTSGGGSQDLSGWTGRLSVGPQIAPWADLLAAGAVLGVGQAVSAGRGRIALRWW